MQALGDYKKNAHWSRCSRAIAFEQFDQFLIFHSARFYSESPTCQGQGRGKFTYQASFCSDFIAPKSVRSRWSGVTETYPCWRALKSVPSSGMAVGESPPIQ